MFVSSCSKECEKAFDCEQKKCFTPSCINGKCDYNAIDNCCGNDICEKTENRCKCGEDCGPCSGKKGDFMEKKCINNECVYTVSSEKLQKLVFSKDKDFGLFKIELMSQYDEPFVIGTSNFTVIMTLKDTDSRLVPPITFTQFRLFERDRLLGKGLTNLQFNSIGDSFGVVVPFDFSMQKSEEDIAVTLKIDYEYKMTTSSGVQTYREDFVESYSNKFHFVNPKMED